MYLLLDMELFSTLSQPVFQALIILIGIAGLGVSTYLHYQKKTNVEGMACPMDGSCEDVITSKYSKFLGLDVEVLGLLYYAVVIVSYSIYLLTAQTLPSWFVLGVIASSALAVLFSAYLTFIQGFTLKMWCTWCLVSASLCALIMILAIPASAVGIGALMAQYGLAISIIGVLVAAAGLGTALSYDFLFLNFLRDFEMLERQASVLDTLNNLTWAALGGVVLTSLGLYLAGHFHPGESLTLLTIIGIILINGSVYNLKVSQEIIGIKFSRNSEEPKSRQNRVYRKAAFVMASISIVSWIALFILKTVEIIAPPSYFLTTYAALLVVASLSGLAIEKIYDLRAKDSIPNWSPLH